MRDIAPLLDSAYLQAIQADTDPHSALGKKHELQRVGLLYVMTKFLRTFGYFLETEAK